MEWRCADCGRVHDEPPERCACGSSNVEPATDEGGRYSLLGVRRRLLSPSDADRSLVREEPYVTLLFRAVVALTLLALLVVVVFVLV
jgi:hypothetical protein